MASASSGSPDDPDRDLFLEHRQTPAPDGPRDSGLRIDLTVSVGYERRRGGTTDRWEARASTVGLLIAGAIVTLLIILIVLPRVMAAFGS